MINNYKEGRFQLWYVLSELVELIDSGEPLSLNGVHSLGLCHYVHFSTLHLPQEIRYTARGEFAKIVAQWCFSHGSGISSFPIHTSRRLSPRCEYSFYAGTERMWRNSEYAKKRRELIDYIINKLEKEMQS